MQKSGDFLPAAGDDFDEQKQTKNVTTSPIAQKNSNEQASSGSNKRRFYFWNSSDPGFGTVPLTEKIGSKNVEVKSSRINRPAVFLAAFTIFMVGATAVLFFRQSYKTDDSRQFDDLRPVRLVSWKIAPGGFYTDYSVSHNGKLIAYSSSQDGGNENIYVKQTTDGERASRYKRRMDKCQSRLVAR